MWWDNNHKANYRDSTGTLEKYIITNNKQKLKKTGSKTSHLKQNYKIIIIIIIIIY
jgi:hypothetical protein